MIRTAGPSDYDAIVTIWLQASLIAHDFIPAHFWAEHAQQMRDSYLPNAETLVIEEDGAIKGFLCLVGEHIPALFIQPDAQGKGYGIRLLTYAKQQRQRLDLCVFERNSAAMGFYQAQGFRPVERRIEEHTGEPEWVMEWSARAKELSE